MNFTSILDVVKVQERVLSYLHWNDLVRLRRVCMETNKVARTHIQQSLEIVPEIEINETDRDFRAFINLNIPTTRIFLNNPSGDWLYRKNEPDTWEFLEKFGPFIKHLRVAELSMFICGKEWDFLDTLIGLENFEAGCIGLGGNAKSLIEQQNRLQIKSELAKKDARFVERNPSLPDIFRQLKTLKIGENSGLVAPGMIDHTHGILRTCQNLGFLSLPFSPTLMTSTLNLTTIQEFIVLATAFGRLYSYIVKRTNDDPESCTLKYLDFKNFLQNTDNPEMERKASFVFVTICEHAMRHGIKLLNVDTFWFQRRDFQPRFESPELGTPVVSLVNIHPMIFPLSMPNLESVDIRSTSRSTVGPNWRQERPHWPSLKRLAITVDSKHSRCSDFEFFGLEEVYIVDTKSLLHFFFVDIRRLALTELSLHFARERDYVAVPKLESIVASCPNLKKLTLGKWPGTNKALITLFNELHGLEEISLEYCANLGNVAFVGIDTRSPVFFKLKQLRKLSLKGLDQMPKITDLLFSTVIRHLRLSHLTLSSNSPLKSISKAAILSLLEGEFADTIEEFSFKSWSLADTSKEEQRQLEKMFRAYNMR